MKEITQRDKMVLEEALRKGIEVNTVYSYMLEYRGNIDLPDSGLCRITFKGEQQENNREKIPAELYNIMSQARKKLFCGETVCKMLFEFIPFENDGYGGSVRIKI